MCDAITKLIVLNQFKTRTGLFPCVPAFLLAFGLAAWTARSQVPSILNHQGKLTVSGTNYTGLAQFKFALITSDFQAGERSLWSHDGTSVGGGEPTGATIPLMVARGVFSVYLGDTNLAGMLQPIPALVFTNSEVSLRVWVNDGVNGSQQLTPDRRITAVGYALIARTVLESPSAATNFTGTLAGEVTGPQGATVVASVGGVLAANVATGANAANAATEANTANTLVRRGASGEFTAGTMTGSFAGSGSELTNLNGSAVATGTVADARLTTNVVLLNGNQAFTGSNRFNGSVQLTNPANSVVGTFTGDGSALTNLTASILVGTAPSATNFTGPLAGDVIGAQKGTVVQMVGGVQASEVAAGATLANAATNSNLSGTLVRRDADGSFAAGQITGFFVGGGLGLTNLTAAAIVGTAPRATNFTAPLAGDVAGPQGATVVQQVGGVSSVDVAFAAGRVFAATSTNVLGSIVRRDPCDASFAAGTITGRFVGDGGGLTNLPTTPPYYAAPAGAVMVSLFSPDAALVAAGYRQFMNTTVPSWSSGSTSNAPTARYGHTTIWTGQGMIAWGGTAGGNTYLSSGGIYTPAEDAWVAVSAVGAPAGRINHTAVWADPQMIVWGGKGTSGYLGTGARFVPGTQVWMPVATSGAPSARMGHVAVWTGSKMIVWGGMNNGGLLDDGAVYDPVLNQWTALAVTNAPTGRMNAVAVWAGDRMVVWGGTGESGELNTGGQLIFTNGAAVQWLSMTTRSAPYPRIGHTAVWTGDRVLIWGGQSGGIPLSDGAAYCPCDEWQTLSSTNAPSPRFDQAAVWTGSEMIIMGGANVAGGLSTGSAYSSSTGQWRPLSSSGNPLARSQLGAVWTGTELVLFGGLSGSAPVTVPQRLTPEPAWYFYRKL